MAWKLQRAKWDWRKYLTPEELARIERSDAAAAKIELARRQYEKKRHIVLASIICRKEIRSRAPARQVRRAESIKERPCALCWCAAALRPSP